MDEDLLANNMSSSSTNGGTALDSTSDSSATTTTLPHDMDILMESDTGIAMVTAATSVATLKQANIKQNGSSKAMSIVHSYNYTGKQRQHERLVEFLSTPTPGKCK